MKTKSKRIIKTFCKRKVPRFASQKNLKKSSKRKIFKPLLPFAPKIENLSRNLPKNPKDMPNTLIHLSMHVSITSYLVMHKTAANYIVKVIIANLSRFLKQSSIHAHAHIKTSSEHHGTLTPSL